MVKSFEVLESADQTVFQSALLLQAAAACDQLEAGGIPALLTQDAGFRVEVPAAFVRQAHSLLFGQATRGEIYFYQG
jgi:hypothetical protein